MLFTCDAMRPSGWLAQASDVKTDGSWVLPAAPSNPNCHVLLIVVKEGSDAGAPMFQLLSHYTQSIADALRRQAHTVLRTCFPTLAVEVCGDCFRWVCGGSGMGLVSRDALVVMAMTMGSLRWACGESQMGSPRWISDGYEMDLRWGRGGYEMGRFKKGLRWV